MPPVWLKTPRVSVDTADISAYDFGVEKNVQASASNTANIQAYLDSDLPVAYFPAGTYRITSPLSVTRTKKIHGDGASTVFNTDSITSTEHVLDIRGTGPSLIEVNTTAIGAEQFTYTFTNASHGLVSGDVVAVRNNTDGSYNPARPYYQSGEFIKVKEVDGPLVTFTSGFYDSYPAGSSNLYRVSMIQTNLSNLTFEGSASNAAERCIGLTFVKDSSITNVSVRDAGNYSGLNFRYCYNVTLTNSISVITQYGSLASTAYPVLISNCQDISISNCSCASPWHAIATGGGAGDTNIVNRGIVFSDSRAESADGIFPVDFHGNVEHSGIYNCTLKGGGATLGANNNVFSGNRITSIRNDSSVSDSSSLIFYTTETVGLGFTITNNVVDSNGWYQFDDFGQFVHIVQNSPAAKASALTISGNQVVCSGQTSSSTSNQMVRINGVGGDGGGDGIGDVIDTTVSITGNTFRSKLASRSAANTIYVSAGSTLSGDHFKAVNVSDNILEGVGVEVISGGVVSIKCNTITQAFIGIYARKSLSLTLSGNSCRNCNSLGVRVNGVYETAIISNNILYDNQSDSPGVVDTNAELYFDDDGLEPPGGTLIANNTIKCRDTTSYMLTLYRASRLTEVGNTFNGSPTERNINTLSILTAIKNFSSASQRSHTFQGPGPIDVCVVTFGNASWGSVNFYAELAVANDFNYTGTYRARLRGHAATTAVVDNKSFTSLTDPTTGTPPPLVFSVVGSVVTIRAQARISTEVTKMNLKIIKAARQVDDRVLTVDWKI